MKLLGSILLLIILSPILRGSEIKWEKIPCKYNFEKSKSSIYCKRVKELKYSSNSKFLYILLDGINTKQFGGANKDKAVTVNQKPFWGSEWRLLIHTYSELAKEKTYSLDLSDQEKNANNLIGYKYIGKNAIEIKLPINILKSSPARFRITLQAINKEQKNTVGREASFHMPPNGWMSFQIPDLPELKSSPKILKQYKKISNGELIYNFKMNNKCDYSATLFRTNGKIQQNITNDHPQRQIRISFDNIPASKYYAIIKFKNIAGKQYVFKSKTIKVNARKANKKSLFLSVRGKYIVDYSGKPFKLVGMARCQYHERSEEIQIGPLDKQLAHYKKLGMNCIRLAIYPNRHHSRKINLQKGDINKFIDKYIAPEVQKIIDAGMYVILDDHRISNTLEQAYANIPLWEALAKRYKDEPRIAVYELWNEPYLLPKGLSPASAKDIRKWYKDCIKAIRKHDKKHIIMVSDWNAGWGDATKSMWTPVNFRPDVPYNQVIFSKHMSKDHCNEQFIKNCLDSVANRWNVPILIGELELEGDLQTSKDLKRLLKILSKSRNKYGVWFWRPHPDKSIFADIWSPWAKKYASKIPKEFYKNKPVFCSKYKWNTIELNSLKFDAATPIYGSKTIKLAKEYPAGLYCFKFICSNKLPTAAGVAVYTSSAGKHMQISPFINRVNRRNIIWKTQKIDVPMTNFIVKKTTKSNQKSITLERIDFRRIDD